MNPPYPSEKPKDSRYRYLYPRSRYRGDFTPANLAFNANLQEFAHQVNFICALETSGKISSLQAYNDIKGLWKQLKKSKKNLRIGQKESEE
ncbi:hypothetical protein [Acaryochloris sp. IP29b_bin.137]|uniref:DUF7219 family protein n=1 Tax=Acaryochloris sp. IP29b_bin.137 TaxID=2969217 RepID=UPI002605980E|nr:hypothetical protein [Acaryochloris sp. IP29b_bin.137]